MTTIIKATRRVTREAYAVLFNGKPRQIIVGIEPGDVLTFREKGRREIFSLPIHRVFKIAIDRKAALDRVENERTKRQRYLAKRGKL